jgi:hypothetical protein
MHLHYEAEIAFGKTRSQDHSFPTLPQLQDIAIFHKMMSGLVILVSTAHIYPYLSQHLFKMAFHYIRGLIINFRQNCCVV